MRYQKIGLLLVLMTILTSSYGQVSESNKNDPALGDMMVRMAAIEIESKYVDEYMAILKEESEASVRMEPGVICIFPMFQKENPTQIRLLEIYANKEAYASHLQTPHFKHYKETTKEMVKDLKLIDMGAIDSESMPEIFRKIMN